MWVLAEKVRSTHASGAGGDKLFFHATITQILFGCNSNDFRRVPLYVLVRFG